MLARHAELEAPPVEVTESSPGPVDLPANKDTVPEPATHPTAPEPATPDPVSVASPQVTPDVTSTPHRETGKRYSSRVAKPPVRYSP